jgi:protein-arginine kinase activator protein McsA
MCSAKWPQDDKTAQWEQYIRDAEKAESGIAAIIQYNLLLEKAVRAEEFSKAAELRDRSAHLGVHLHLQATREYQVG